MYLLPLFKKKKLFQLSALLTLIQHAKLVWGGGILGDMTFERRTFERRDIWVPHITASDIWAPV
jgi:hypothetical protein